MKTYINRSTKSSSFKISLNCLCLLMLITIIAGCSTISTPQRGDLPYYSLSNPLFTMTKVGSLEQEYQDSSGAIIIKLVDGPIHYEKDIYLEPGSAEEKLYLKSGAEKNVAGNYYTYNAEVVKIIDDRELNIRQKDIITVKNVFCFSLNDPLYQYQQIDPSQEYMIFLAQEDKDIDKNIFWYSIRAAFYVKDSVVFSTNNEESIDSYSGMNVDEIAETLSGFAS